MVKIEKIGSEEIAAAVKENDGYCPCMRTKTPDTKCMCKEFKDQQSTGLCYCERFMKVEVNNEI